MDNDVHLGGLISGGFFVFITRSQLRPEMGGFRLSDKFVWTGAIVALTAFVRTGVH